MDPFSPYQLIYIYIYILYVRVGPHLTKISGSVLARINQLYNNLMSKCLKYECMLSFNSSLIVFDVGDVTNGVTGV